MAVDVGSMSKADLQALLASIQEQIKVADSHEREAADMVKAVARGKFCDTVNPIILHTLGPYAERAKELGFSIIGLNVQESPLLPVNQMVAVRAPTGKAKSPGHGKPATSGIPRGAGQYAGMQEFFNLHTSDEDKAEVAAATEVAVTTALAEGHYDGDPGKARNSKGYSIRQQWARRRLKELGYDSYALALAAAS